MNDTFPFSQTNNSQPKPYKMVSLNFFLYVKTKFLKFSIVMDDTFSRPVIRSFVLASHHSREYFTKLIVPSCDCCDIKPINDIISLIKVQTDLQS